MIFNLEYNTEEQSQQKPINGNDESKDADISDILLWAIFANRKDIAEICWLRGDNHLCNFIFLICKFRYVWIIASGVGVAKNSTYEKITNPLSWLGECPFLLTAWTLNKDALFEDKRCLNGIK